MRSKYIWWSGLTNSPICDWRSTTGLPLYVLLTFFRYFHILHESYIWHCKILPPFPYYLLSPLQPKAHFTSTFNIVFALLLTEGIVKVDLPGGWGRLPVPIVNPLQGLESKNMMGKYWFLVICMSDSPPACTRESWVHWCSRPPKWNPDSGSLRRPGRGNILTFCPGLSWSGQCAQDTTRHASDTTRHHHIHANGRTKVF